MNNLKPMLAGKAPKDLGHLKYPLLASAKLDGFRAVIIPKADYIERFGFDDIASGAQHAITLTRSMKPLANRATQALLDKSELVGLDGELLVGEPTDTAVFQRTTSALRTVSGEPDVRYHVFDCWRSSEIFEDRVRGISQRSNLPSFVRTLKQVEVSTVSALESLEADYLSAGYEGAILRDPNGLYKFGRSTTKEGGMLKLKRYVDAEAVVVGCVEKMHNANEAFTNELGAMTRSSHSGNLVPTGALGALIVRNAHGVEFNVGTGFDDAQRLEYWAQRNDLIGAVIKYKSFLIGVKEKPRHPVFLGFRAPEDVS